MQTQELGKSGLKVAPWAFGGNVFGWTADQSASFQLLDAFVGHGFSLIDSADVYSRWAPGHSGGESETMIGDWLAQGGAKERASRREKVVIATKLGNPSFLAKAKPEVVEEQREREADTRRDRERLKAAYERLEAV